MKKTKRIVFPILTLLLFVLVLAFAAFGQSNTAETKQSTQWIGIIDACETDEEFQARNHSAGIENRLKDFNLFLENECGAYSLYEQSLYAKNPWTAGDQFLEASSRGLEKNQVVHAEGKEYLISSLKTIEANQRMFLTFLNHIAEGSGFTEDDFSYRFGDKVPVILGSQYRQYYNIGDELNLEYLFQDTTFYVKGFFSEGLKLHVGNSTHDLDTYVCVPFFQIKEKESMTDEERGFWIRYYGLKNDVYLKTEDYEADKDSFRNRISEKAKEYGMEYTTLDMPYTFSISGI